MNKNINRVLSFICLIFVIFALVGCLDMGSKAESAYDIAVRNGFVGTEEEWLESLKGKDGESLNIVDIYNAVKADGYEGSLTDFVNEYFNGAEINGKSAYDVAVENGYSGTEEEWLESLRGIAGADGEKGDSIDLYATYEQLIKLGEIDCSFLEFVQTYLNVDLNLGNEKAISKGLRSAVSIYALTDSLDEIDEDTTGSIGAGVIFKINKETGSAYIITNLHVVYSDNSAGAYKYIYLFLYGQESNEYAIEASFVGGSATYDIAVLKVENSDVLKESDAIAVDVFDSNEIVVGSTAIAIGNPHSDGIAATEGIISVDSETIYMDPIRTDNVALNPDGSVSMRVLRIDASVNRGNSGGGLYNADGQLIGIVNARNKSTSAENIGYAIPSNIAVNVAQNIIDNCNGTTSTLPIKCTIGVSVKVISMKSVYNEKKGTVDIVSEIQVVEVGANTPASGNFMAGDILVSMTLRGVRYEITRNFVVLDACLNARSGDKATFEVLRNGVLTTVEITFKTGNPVG